MLLWFLLNYCYLVGILVSRPLEHGCYGLIQSHRYSYGLIFWIVTWLWLGFGVPLIDTFTLATRAVEVANYDYVKEHYLSCILNRFTAGGCRCMWKADPGNGCGMKQSDWYYVGFFTFFQVDLDVGTNTKLQVLFDKMVQKNCASGWERRIRFFVVDGSSMYWCLDQVFRSDRDESSM